MSSKYLNLVANANLCAVALSLVVVLTAYLGKLYYRWRNPKCAGALPPGCMGLPFIGETLQLVMPSASLDLQPFIKHRLKKYGLIFRTSVAGRPVIITADREFNYYILNQIGKLVDTWSLDTFAEVFDQAKQSSRKYIRNITLNHFGVEALREKLIPRMEQMVSRTLADWSSRDSVEVKSASITMTVDFAAMQLLSGDLEDAPLNLSAMFNDLVEGLMSFPLNVPGTAHHRCLKVHKEVKKTMRDVLRKRKLSTDETPRDDLLDHLIQDMNREPFLTEDFVVQLMFGLLFVTSDSISTSMALALKLLEEHPSVLQELTNEHEAILRSRENVESPLSWDEYKSMTYTRQVINEVLRLGNIAPGLFRRALKDIPVNGYTIPEGWIILIATSALHLDNDQFNNALEFNPGRWKDIQTSVVAKSFMPFGVGIKQCAGAEYSRVLLATFLHVLVTKYKWAMVKGGKIVRAPIIRFPEGFHFKISEKKTDPTTSSLSY